MISGASGIRIEPADQPRDLRAVRRLLEEYGPSLAIDLEYQSFAEELRTLPGRYAPPQGSLLLARQGARAVGCVALRALSSVDCEMKRLYVRPAFRRHGLGRALVERIVAEAQRIGYRRMLLDSLPTMTDAMKLYRSIGFRDTAPYTQSPVPGTVFLEMRLEPAAEADG